MEHQSMQELWQDASGLKGFAARVDPRSSVEQRAAILRAATGARTPVTVSGAGTGVTGGRVPSGGCVISTENFRRLEVFEGQAIVGAGVLLQDLQKAAEKTGQFYGPDPTESTSSLGGNIATNASGSRSFRFGATRRHVRALTVVTMSGEVLQLRRPGKVPFPYSPVRMPATSKHATGYPLQQPMDYVDLFIGSEGTLGVVVEAEVALLPLSPEVLAGVIFFTSGAECLQAVAKWRPVHGLQMIEYFDRHSLRLLRSRYGLIPANAEAALMIEQELINDTDLDDWLNRIELAGAMGEASWFATSASEREQFRRFRHALPELVNDTIRQRGLLKLGTDFAVPFEQNDRMMRFYEDSLQESFPEQHVIFGHIGDAHVHANLLPKSGDEAGRAKDLMIKMARKAVELGGTVSAEHGLGKRKAYLLPIQFNRDEIESMKEVKRHLDPYWLLGQGTLFV